MSNLNNYLMEKAASAHNQRIIASALAMCDGSMQKKAEESAHNQHIIASALATCDGSIHKQASEPRHLKLRPGTRIPQPIYQEAPDYGRGFGNITGGLVGGAGGAGLGGLTGAGLGGLTGAGVGGAIGNSIGKAITTGGFGKGGVSQGIRALARLLPVATGAIGGGAIGGGLGGLTGAGVGGLAGIGAGSSVGGSLFGNSR